MFVFIPLLKFGYSDVYIEKQTMLRVFELTHAINGLAEHEAAINSFYDRKRKLEKDLNVEPGKEIQKEVLIEYLTGADNDGYNDINNFIDMLAKNSNEAE